MPSHSAKKAKQWIVKRSFVRSEFFLVKARSAQQAERLFEELPEDKLVLLNARDDCEEVDVLPATKDDLALKPIPRHDALPVQISKLVVLQVTDSSQEETTILLTSVHTTREKALDHLHAWVGHWWKEQAQATDLPKERDAAIREYFAFWTPEQEYSLEEVPLDPALCAACGEDKCRGVQTCPACGASCHDDATIPDHGCCRDCHHERLMDGAPGEDG